ncbi:hypothetical protein EZS27_017907 [termite gut metagenome]|uniref:Uncharacterized protein n=1 Tax=termite gut metagenome TaxID=433724 RepID=A0A5J4RHS4_9ZZZZ
MTRPLLLCFVIFFSVFATIYSIFIIKTIKCHTWYMKEEAVLEAVSLFFRKINFISFSQFISRTKYIYDFMYIEFFHIIASGT